MGVVETEMKYISLGASHKGASHKGAKHNIHPDGNSDWVAGGNSNQGWEGGQMGEIPIDFRERVESSSLFWLSFCASSPPLSFLLPC